MSNARHQHPWAVGSSERSWDRMQKDAMSRQSFLNFSSPVTWYAHAKPTGSQFDE